MSVDRIRYDEIQELKEELQMRREIHDETLEENKRLKRLEQKITIMQKNAMIHRDLTVSSICQELLSDSQDSRHGKGVKPIPEWGPEDDKIFDNYEKNPDDEIDEESPDSRDGIGNV